MIVALSSRFRIAAAVCASIYVAGCSRTDIAPPAVTLAATPARDTALLTPAAAAAAGFTLATAEVKPWRDVWSVPARITLDAANTQTIGSIVEGRVTEVYVRPGDMVRPGQVLLTIHSHEMTDARSNLAKAHAAATETEASAQLAAAESARAERLYAAKALSLADLERARTASVSAAAMRKSAEAELERSRSMVGHLLGDGPVAKGIDDHAVLIRSTISGTVVTRTAQAGAVVLVGAPLMTVSRITTLMLVAQLPERALGAAKQGSEVTFSVAAYPDRAFTATVARVAPALDSLTRTIEVQATIKDPSGALKPEMFATAQLLGAPGAAALSIPAAAVQALDGDTVAITATTQGAAMQLEALRIHVGRRTALTAEVLDGLAPGATVIAGRASIAKAEIAKRRATGN